MGESTAPAPVGGRGRVMAVTFLGVLFEEGAVITRVRITTGNTLPNMADGGMFDVVMMDDFIYSEPVPEPGTLALFALGLAGLGRIGRARRPR